MKKVIPFTLFLTGIVTIFYTVQKAETMYSLYTILHYAPMLLAGVAACVLGGILLIVFRKAAAPAGVLPAILGTTGSTMTLWIGLQAGIEALYSTRYIGVSSYINLDSVSGFSYALFVLKNNWICLLLGIVFLITGIVWGIKDRKRQLRQEPEEAQTVEAQPPQYQQEEWVITLFCTVTDIRGDYAVVKYDDSGVESEVAIALLPFGIDTGDRLKYENYEFFAV